MGELEDKIQRLEEEIEILKKELEVVKRALRNEIARYEISQVKVGREVRSIVE
ncbi:MAG: hypothetical protein ACE5J2_01495 [Nitrososphaerales archaeon]